MKSLKKIGVLLLVLIMTVSTIACGKEESVTYSEMDYMEMDLTTYVTLGQYKDLTLAADPIVVTDADVESMVQNLIANNSKYEEYEEPVTDRLTEAGDYLLIDFAGFMEGEQFERGTAEGAYVLLIEDNGYIDWFEDDLYGVMPGTTVETTNFFPENYGDQAVAGKEATFKITVHSIVGHYTVPELTDEFVKSITGCETVDAYRELVRAALLADATAAANQTRYQILWEAVLANATIHTLPEQQVMFYYTSERSYYESVAEQNGYTYEEFLEAYGVTDADIMKMVEDAVREELVFYAIVKAENIIVTEEEYIAAAEGYAEVNGVTLEELEATYGYDYIVQAVLWDKVIYTLFDLTTFVSE